MKEYKNLEIQYWGLILFGEEIRDPDTEQALGELYLRHQEHLCESIYGSFTILIADREKKQLLALRSEYGSPTDLYFHWNGSEYEMSPALSAVLTRKGTVERNDEANLSFFSQHGFPPGLTTLIRDVYRVPPGTYVRLTNRDQMIQSGPVRTKMGRAYTTNEAKERYPILLRAAVKEYIGKAEKIGISLSGGFDSNFLLWQLNKLELPIDAFTVGGKTGRNEISKAEISAGCYQNVCLHSHVVDGSTLLQLEEIVWKLEGSVYERGIFLQYELAKSAHLQEIQKIVAGEGADQIMNENYCLWDSVNPFRSGDIWHETPDIALRNLVLPKSAKMLHAFGVQGCYPYLHPEMVSCFRALAKLNGTTKAFHTETVRSTVDRRIAEILENVGGATFISTLFEDLDEDEIARRGWTLPNPERLAEEHPPETVKRILSDSIKALYLETFFEIMTSPERRDACSARYAPHPAFLTAPATCISP